MRRHGYGKGQELWRRRVRLMNMKDETLNGVEGVTDGIRCSDDNARNVVHLDTPVNGLWAVRVKAFNCIDIESADALLQESLV